jgi:hypothetical protein
MRNIGVWPHAGLIQIQLFICTQSYLCKIYVNLLLVTRALSLESNLVKGRWSILWVLVLNELDLWGWRIQVKPSSSLQKLDYKGKHRLIFVAMPHTEHKDFLIRGYTTSSDIVLYSRLSYEVRKVNRRVCCVHDYILDDILGGIAQSLIVW